MAELFASGRIADVVIALMVMEAIALVAYRSFSGHGIETSQVLTNLAAGICLFMAVRFALTAADWPWIGGSLALALVAHVADLRSRWRT